MAKSKSSKNSLSSRIASASAKTKSLLSQGKKTLAARNSGGGSSSSSSSRGKSLGSYQGVELFEGENLTARINEIKGGGGQAGTTQEADTQDFQDQAVTPEIPVAPEAIAEEQPVTPEEQAVDTTQPTGDAPRGKSLGSYYGTELFEGEDIGARVKKLSADQRALQGLMASGGDATADGASGAVPGALPDENNLPESTQAVDNFFQTNPGVQQSTQDLMEWLAPQSMKDEMFSQMKKIVGEQNALSRDKLELMSMNRLMAGTADDLRDEVEAANGFATESQIQALSISRNSILMKQATMLQDQISYQQDLIANDINLLNFEKSMADSQYSQRMGILNYQKQNDQFMYNAWQDTLDGQIKDLGWDGILEAYSDNPNRLDQIMNSKGMTMEGAKIAARRDAEERKKKVSKPKEEETIDISDVQKYMETYGFRPPIGTPTAEVDEFITNNPGLGGREYQALIDKIYGGAPQGTATSFRASYASNDALAAQLGLTPEEIEAARKIYNEQQIFESLLDYQPEEDDTTE